MEVVVPLLGVSGVTILAISTPLDETNWYSQMIDARGPSGDKVFLTMEVGLFCEKCKAEGRHTRGEECPHLAHNRPPWKSGQRHELVKSLMSSNKDMFMREQLGLISRSESRAFSQEAVDEFARSSKSFMGGRPIEHVFVAIDPAGGGSSCLAIVCGVMTDAGELVVISGDSLKINTDEDLEHALASHLTMVRSDPALYAATLVTIIEANYGGWVAASRVANIIEPFGPVKHIRGDRTPAERIGVMLNESVKQRMRVDTQRLFRMKQILMYAKFYSKTPDCKAELISQINNYRVEWREAKDIYGKAKFTLTGKRYAKNDDMAICMQYLAYYPSHFYATAAAEVEHRGF